MGYRHQNEVLDRDTCPNCCKTLFHSPRADTYRIHSHIRTQLKTNDDLSTFLDRDIFSILALSEPREPWTIEFDGLEQLDLKAIGRLVAIASTVKEYGGCLTLTGLSAEAIPAGLRSRLAELVHLTQPAPDSCVTIDGR